MNIYYIAGIVEESDGSGYTAYFPDVPEVCASGVTMQKVLFYAGEGLRQALRTRVEEGKAIPAPCSMEEARERVRDERNQVELPFPEDSLFQYFPAPDLDMAPVRVNISIPKAILKEIDYKAKLAGMTRSGYIAAACQDFEYVSSEEE